MAGVDEIITRDDVEMDARYADDFVCRSVVEKLNALKTEIMRLGRLQREGAAA